MTVHTNAIVVTISIADLIGGAATQTFAPGGKHPGAATAVAGQGIHEIERPTSGVDRNSQWRGSRVETSRG